MIIKITNVYLTKKEEKNEKDGDNCNGNRSYGLWDVHFWMW